jgi:hypothetical protein
VATQLAACQEGLSSMELNEGMRKGQALDRPLHRDLSRSIVHPRLLQPSNSPTLRMKCSILLGSHLPPGDETLSKLWLTVT